VSGRARFDDIRTFRSPPSPPRVGTPQADARADRRQGLASIDI